MMRLSSINLWVILSCSVFWISPNAFTQSEYWFFNELNQNKGLSEQNNADFSESANGFMWIGSRNGLNRFDGKKVKVYLPIIPGIGIDPVLTSKVFEDHRGGAWFSTIGGIHHLSMENDSISSKVLERPDSTGLAKVHYAIHLDEESNLWVVADSNLYIINTNSWRDSILQPFSAYLCYPVSNEEGKLTKLVKPLMEEPAGLEILTFTKDEPIKKRYFVKHDENDLPEAVIFYIYVENDTTIWLPSNLGLIRFNPDDPKNYQKFTIENGRVPSSMVDVQPWGERFLWLASSREGLLLFDKEKPGFVRSDTMAWVDNRLIDLPRINKLHIDDADNLWLAIWGERVIYTSLRNTKFSALLGPDKVGGSGRKSVSSIIEDKDRELWVNVPGDGIYIYNKNHKQISFKNPFSFQSKPERGQRARALLCDTDGDVWILSYNHLIIWKRSSDRFELVNDTIPKLRKITQIGPNSFLLLTYDGVYKLSKVQKKGVSLQKVPFAELSEYIQLFHTKDGLLMLSGVNDLFIYESRSGAFHLIQQKENVGLLTGMVEDENFFWFTSNRGFFKIDKKDWSVAFPEDEGGLLRRPFNSILIDEEGRFWLSSNAGIFQYHPLLREVFQYTESDGLRSLQYNEESQLISAEGTLYFGGTNGLTYFDSKDVRLNETLPAVQLTDIIVNGKDTLKGYNLFEETALTFPFKQNTLSFHFVAMEYSAPDENQHAYFLEGYDKDTVYTGQSGFAHYPNLPHGKYTLRLMGSNSDGLWTPYPRELSLIIHPPWYQTWWFYTLVAFAIIGSIIGLYQSQINRIKKREALKLKEAENQMAILRLQMSPHFIFNSMAAIGSYIIGKETMTAYNYLQRFSRLMRNILIKAPKPWISLSEEMELLEPYLAVEALRLENKFDWEFVMDPQIEPDETLIPTMILQPFVENAIQHGITPKEGKGNIKISFQKEQNQLVCIVEDDGVGRTAAAKHKTPGHQSKALSITSERLRILKERTGQPAFHEIKDLVDSKTNACGTRVIVSLPLEE